MTVFNNLFSSGIQKEVQRAMFNQLPKRDQTAVLQHVYDQGYSAREIGREMNIATQSVYSRIEAHRGRGPKDKPSQNPDGSPVPA